MLMQINNMLPGTRIMVMKVTGLSMYLKFKAMRIYQMICFGM